MDFLTLLDAHLGTFILPVCMTALIVYDLMNGTRGRKVFSVLGTILYLLFWCYTWFGASRYDAGNMFLTVVFATVFWTSVCHILTGRHFKYRDFRVVVIIVSVLWIFGAAGAYNEARDIFSMTAGNGIASATEVSVPNELRMLEIAHLMSSSSFSLVNTFFLSYPLFAWMRVQRKNVTIVQTSSARKFFSWFFVVLCIFFIIASTGHGIGPLCEYTH